MRRLPGLSADMEIVFVEGGSGGNRDIGGDRGTVRAARANGDIKALKQPGKGKGDAVRLGLSRARGDVLMISTAF